MKPEFEVSRVMLCIYRGTQDTMLPQHADWDVEEPIPMDYAERIVENLKGREFRFEGFNNPGKITAISVADIGEFRFPFEGEKLVKFSVTVFCEGSFMEGALWLTVDAVHQAIFDEYARLKQFAADLEFVRTLA